MNYVIDYWRGVVLISVAILRHAAATQAVGLSARSQHWCNWYSSHCLQPQQREESPWADLSRRPAIPTQSCRGEFGFRNGGGRSIKGRCALRLLNRRRDCRSLGNLSHGGSLGGLESRFFKAFRAEVSMLVGGSSRAEGGSAGGVDCCTGRAGDGIRVPAVAKVSSSLSRSRLAYASLWAWRRELGD